jgi:hypothetical protein
MQPVFDSNIIFSGEKLYYSGHDTLPLDYEHYYSAYDDVEKNFWIFLIDNNTLKFYNIKERIIKEEIIISTDTKPSEYSQVFIANNIALVKDSINSHYIIVDLKERLPRVFSLEEPNRVGTVRGFNGEVIFF